MPQPCSQCRPIVQPKPPPGKLPGDFWLAQRPAAREITPPEMGWRTRIYGGVVGLIGFVLSPLSWWNDLFVNIPLALGFAWLVALVYPPAFECAAIFGYWATNLLGFILMHKGAKAMLARGETPPRHSSREWTRDLLISLGYTLFMVLLIKLGVLKPITGYFQPK